MAVSLNTKSGVVIDRDVSGHYPAKAQGARRRVRRQGKAELRKDLATGNV